MNNNVSKTVSSGLCTGCGACDVCEHIVFEQNALGFPSPVVDDRCRQCGRCLTLCIYAPDAEDD